jgi:hydrogenase nickel incorporation protein HypB
MYHFRKEQVANHHKEFHKGSQPHTHGTNEAAVHTVKSGTREIKVIRRVLDVNDQMAEQNRRLFADHGIFVLNVMSSPGSGKTTTLEKTLAEIMPEIGCAVIVGEGILFVLPNSTSAKTRVLSF